MEQNKPTAPTNRIHKNTAKIAAKWLMQLHSEDFTAQDLQACKLWRQKHSTHEQAWQEVKKIQVKLGLIPAKTAMKSLNRQDRPNRRQLFKSLIPIILITPVGYITYRTQPWREWTTDYATSKGQQQQVILADGSQLYLNTATIVNIDFNNQQRKIVLLQGKILLKTNQNNSDFFNIPIIVQTAQGKLQPIGTKFIVQQLNNKTLTKLSVLEGLVEITPTRNPIAKQIPAGQSVLFSDNHIFTEKPIQKYTDSWTKGFIHIRNMRLADFLQEINRYRPGILRCDPQVADLKISGSFMLKNTDHILNALPATLPVSINYLTAYWVTVQAPKK